MLVPVAAVGVLGGIDGYALEAAPANRKDKRIPRFESLRCTSLVNSLKENTFIFSYTHLVHGY